MKKHIIILSVAIILLFPLFAHAAGFFGGGGGGSAGGTTVTMAAGNAIIRGDAVTGANTPATGSNAASSTTLSAPAITTYANGDTILSIIGNGGTPTEPVTPTQLIAPTQPASYGFYVGYQTQVTAGTLAARTGTQTSGDTAGFSIAVVPVSGKSISYAISTPSAGGGSVAANGSLTFTWGVVPPNGTLLLSCYTIFTTTPPTGTLISTFVKLPNAQSVAGHEGVTCSMRWASSEPSSLSITAPSTSGLTAFEIALTNAAALDQPVTSATGTFNSGDVGKDYCLQYAANSYVNQLCGKIQAVNSATSIYPSFLPQSGISAAGLSVPNVEYVYCTDNTTQWATTMPAALTASGGGSVVMPGVPDCVNGDINGKGTAQIVWPNYVPINLMGQTAGTPYGTTYNILNPNLGSALIDMSTIGTTPLMQLGSATYDACISNFVHFSISNFALIGGAGLANDGGGNEGIQIVNQPWINFDNFRVYNFASNGIHLISAEDVGSVNPCPYLDGLDMQDSWSTFNNGDGVLVECVNAGGTFKPSVQNLTFINDQMDGNQASGVEFKNCSAHSGKSNAPIWSLVMHGNNMQRNWYTSYVGAGCTQTTCFQLYSNNSSITGGEVSGNYFEDDHSHVGAANQTFGWSFTHWGPQSYSGAPFRPLFNNSTNPIESNAAALSFGTYNAPVCVNDATITTVGGTYTGGGANIEAVIYNGTNWIIQGPFGCE